MAAHPENHWDSNESVVYDRQIRLWGMESQKRIRNSKVLIIGMCEVAEECMKNLTLTGIKELNLCDERNVEVSNVEKSFLLQPQDIGSSISEALAAATQHFNTNAIVSGYKTLDEIKDKITNDSESVYDAICIFNNPSHIDHIRSIRGKDTRVYFVFASETCGYYRMFLHSECDPTSQFKNIKDSNNRKYPTNLEELVEQTCKAVERSNTSRPNVAVSSVLGGMLSQEIIKTITDDKVNGRSQEYLYYYSSIENAGYTFT